MTWPRFFDNLVSEFLYLEAEDGAEPLASYCAGGAHPVHLDEHYPSSTCNGGREGRYRIIHKLGDGHFSTVWLAQDSSLPE